MHESLFRRPAQKVRRNCGARDEIKRGRLPILGALCSVKRYARMVREEKSLSPRKAPGSRPMMDECASKLLEAWGYHPSDQPLFDLLV